MKKVRAALIGAGGYGGVYVSHLGDLAQQGKVDFAAAVIRHPEKIPDTVNRLKGFGTAIYPSSEAMYAAEKGRLDLVCIPTGIEFHEPMTREALENGANVLVEKPVAGSVAQAQSMMAAASAHPRQFVMVGFQHVAARELQQIKRVLLSGRLGRVKRIRALGIWPRPDSYYARNDWAGKICNHGTQVLDSPINNAFAHYLNIALFLAGDKFEVAATPTAIEAELYRARNIETFDSCAVRLQTDSGVEIVELLTHTALRAHEPEIRIDCEAGSVEWQQGGVWAIREASQAILDGGKTPAPHRSMFEDALARVSDPEVFVCSLPLASMQTRCIEALYRHFEPVTLGAPTVRRRESDGQLSVDGLETLWQAAFDAGKLPHEMGLAAWTRGSSRFSM